MSQTTTSKNLMEKWLSTFNFNPIGERKKDTKESRCRSYSMTLLNKSGKSIESSTNNSTVQLPTTYLHQGQANGKLTKRNSIEARMAFWTISLLKVKCNNATDIAEEDGYYSDTLDSIPTNESTTFTNATKNLPFKYLTTATPLSKSKSINSNKSSKTLITNKEANSKQQNGNLYHKSYNLPCQRTACKDCFPTNLNVKAKLNSNSTSTTVTPTLTISSGNSSKALEEMKEMMKLMQLEENSAADFSSNNSSVPVNSETNNTHRYVDPLHYYASNTFICQSSDLQMENIEYYEDSDSDECSYSYLNNEASSSPTSSFINKTKPCYIVAAHPTD